MVITHTIPKKRRRPPDGCNKPDITQEIVFEVSLLFSFFLFIFFREKKIPGESNQHTLFSHTHTHTHNITLAHSKTHMSVNRCICEATVHLMTFMVHRGSLFVSCERDQVDKSASNTDGRNTKSRLL